MYRNILGLTAGLMALICFSGHGQSIQGTVVDTAGRPVAYATILVKGTTTGAVAKPDGQFKVNAPTPGTVNLQISCLGYRTEDITLQVKADLRGLVVELVEEELFQDDLIITADGRDPAYGIMRRAIALRQKNNLAVRAWSAQAYSKLVVYDREDKKVAALTETFSTVYVKKPSQRKEVIHRSRVSGDSRAYSALGALYANVNPYEATIALEIFDRPFVTPLSPNAFLFYDFKYLGNSRDRGRNFYKIAMLPKRGSDPVFEGVVYIDHLTHAVAGLDWLITKRRPIKYLDSLRTRQEYAPVLDSLWVPTKNEVSGSLNQSLVVERVNLSASLLNVYTNYTIADPLPGGGRGTLITPGNATDVGLPRRGGLKQAPTEVGSGETAPAAEPQPRVSAADSLRAVAEARRKDALADSLKKAMLAGKFFREVLRVEDSVRSGSRDDTLWSSLRPIELDSAEVADFRRGDSLEARRKDPAYLDSLNRANNRFKPLELLTGYRYTNSANQNFWGFQAITNTVQYNTTEGWNLTFSPYKRWHLDQDQTRWIDLRSSLRYAFAKERLFWQVQGRWHLNSKTRDELALSASSYVHVFGGREQIDPLTNSLYALLAERDYLRQYRSTGLTLSYGRRLNKDQSLTLSTGLERRYSMPQVTDFVFTPRERTFDPNITIPTHWHAYAQAGLTLRFGNQIMRLPERTVYLDGGWPQLRLNYTLGTQFANFGTTSQPESPGELPANTRIVYHQLEAIALDDYNLKLLGKGQWYLRAGANITDADSLLFPDRFHVLGNQVAVVDDRINRFGALNYYSFSASGQLMEAHWTHNFGGFIFNKIPLWRRLKLHELVGLHTVITPNQNRPDNPGDTPHTELMLGLTNIRILRLSLFKVQYHQVLTGPSQGFSRVTVTIGLDTDS